MRVYLDLCALKRPFDDQTQDRIASETGAVLAIMTRIELGLDDIVWSVALTVENDADPDVEARVEVAKYVSYATVSLVLTTQVEKRLREFTVAGFSPLDAAHLAFAESAGCTVLVTCDDRFIKRAERIDSLVRVLTPIQYWNEVAHD